MTEAAQNFEMVIGNDVDVEITVKDTDGVIKDITGASVKFAVAPSRGDPVSFTKVTPTEITIAVGSDGKFVVHIDPIDTADLEEGVYVFEAETTDISGNIVAVTLGRILLYKSII